MLDTLESARQDVKEKMIVVQMFRVQRSAAPLA
jgi:hypothetical protein